MAMWQPKLPIAERPDPSARPNAPSGNVVDDPGALVARAHGIERSPEWPKVAAAHLAVQPRCVCCAPGKSALAPPQVHHIFPFHYCIALGRPDLELDLRNLITLCESEPGRPAENHHLLVGHLDSFQSSSLDVAHDARTLFFGQTAAEIRASRAWRQRVRVRLLPLEQLDAAGRAEFRARMDRALPRK